MQEHRHSGARALPASPESRTTDQRNQWLGQCSWFPGPPLTGRPGMTREFFSSLLREGYWSLLKSILRCERGGEFDVYGPTMLPSLRFRSREVWLGVSPIFTRLNWAWSVSNLVTSVQSLALCGRKVAADAVGEVK